MEKLKIALGISSGFEGSGFDQVTGNFDGQGISAGALQWNYGQGTLQTLLALYIKQYGSIENFPDDINPSAGMGTKDAIAFSLAMQQNNQLLPNWKRSWQAFLTSPGCVDIQVQLAIPFGRYADYMCRVWKLPSTRAYCFFFDIRVQNGSMLGLPGRAPSIDEYNRIVAASDPKNRVVWQALTPTAEQMVLIQAAWDRSLKAKPAYQQNILARKGTIIMGSGVVNARPWALNDLLASSSP